MPTFENGRATTCPDCGGDLQYQNRQSIVCLGCDGDFEHWKNTTTHHLVSVDVRTGSSEIVESTPRDDREIRCDGGHTPDPQKASDEQILARVRECYDDDQTLGGGGVHPETLAEGLPIAENTTRNRCKRLADEGELERDWGFGDGQYQLGYRPARDRTVEMRDSETRDDNTHASVVDAQLAEADDDLRDELEERHDDDREIRADGGVPSSDGTEQRDCGVSAAGGLVCQNFEVHPGEEVKMQSGPFDGVMCPECGRMAGGGPPLDIPSVDEPGTPAAQSSTATERSGDSE